ncbi:hypothetical protein EDB81DRAFT_844225 [Dactylonectria macrodidyma]|uniref:Rhodopsin domain-containing protein n=1 Tax=Dactylonectria macrodidyma TaxID=307937 RepID=A0A9P9J197_9HYPO|nr:hypothetical protein EDB81DRAFT_844225 [Dactylonectria macrodidyma]
MISAPSGAAVLGVIYTLITLAALLIAARVHLRLKIQKRKLVAADWLMILAWCSAFTTASFDIVFMNQGALEPNIHYTLNNWDTKPERLEYVLRMMWAALIPFFTTFYLCKASLLAVYLELFPPFMTKRRIVLWTTIIYSALAYVVSICLQLFLCFPIERNWTIMEPEMLCDAFAVVTTFQVAWTLHFLGSIALFILPFLILYKLNLRKRMKIGVYCVFLLGLVDISFSLTRFLTVQLSAVGGFRSVTTIELWSSLDAYIGLIIACLPALRPYLRRNWGASYEYGYNDSARPANSSLPSRRPGQSGFEEIDETPSLESSDNVNCAPGVRNISGPSEIGTDDAWNDDKKSNRSDIELVNINIRTPVKERAHI